MPTGNSTGKPRRSKRLPLKEISLSSLNMKWV